MKRSSFGDAQLLAILKLGEAATAVADICRDHAISDETGALLENP